MTPCGCSGAPPTASMRDAMSLTDQAIAFGEGRCWPQTCGRCSVPSITARSMACSRPCWRAMRAPCSKRCATWPSRGRTGVLAEILNVLHRVAIAQALPEAIDNGQGDRERVLALAGVAGGRRTVLLPDGLIGRRDLPLAPIRVAASRWCCCGCSRSARRTPTACRGRR